MYPIDFNTATALDVIERSATLHPTLFADQLHRAALVHEHFADGMVYHTEARDIARKLARACEYAASNVLDGRVDLICNDFDQKTSALTIALKLQVAPRHCYDGIASR